MKRRMNTLHLAAACSMLQARGACWACVAATAACGGRAGRCLLVPMVQLTKLLVATFLLCCILAAGSACHWLFVACGFIVRLSTCFGKNRGQPHLSPAPHHPKPSGTTEVNSRCI